MFSKAVMFPAIAVSLSVTVEAAEYLYDVFTETEPFSLRLLEDNDFNMVPAIHVWVYKWACSHNKSTYESLAFLRKEVFRIQMRKTAVSNDYVMANQTNEYFACFVNFDPDNLNEFGLFTTVTPEELKDLGYSDFAELEPFAAV
jgi:hypothetical protein